MYFGCKVPHELRDLNNQFENLLQALDNLESKGYVTSLLFVNNQLYNANSGEFYEPDEVFIYEFHRFEGTTDLEDMAVVYAIDLPNGDKGLIIDAYGTYADTELGSFIKKIKPVSAR